MNSITTKKIGRNDPCPCGSGKKYKACCLSGVERQQPVTLHNVSSLLAEAWKAVARRDVKATLGGFRRVLSIQPDNVQALAGLGQALCWQDQVREGLGYLMQAAGHLQIQAEKTRDIRFIIELAEQLHHWGELDTAMQLAELAVRLAPDSAMARNNLALYLSRVNRNEEALPHARRACELLPDGPACNSLLALLDSRLGRLAEARERYERVATHTRDPQQSARAWMELAAVLDNMGEYEQAFEACLKAKAMQCRNPKVLAVDKESVFRNIARNRAGFDHELLNRWSREDYADGLPAPIFLMGFLRSGTTLTEQVLGAHPDVLTSDENNLINGLTRELGRVSGCGDDVPAGLRRIDIEMARGLRALYWRRVVEEYGSAATARRFVDKVALNSIDVGFISTIFPESRILFALRDPRDVCLSCFMQSFHPTTATVNLFDWEAVARQYAAVMDLWLHLKDRIAPRFLELRYEDTVDDFENTFRHVFALVGLDWSAEVTSFHERAKGRYIATPSFAAVSQPIYRSALARWRHYEKHFASILPELQRFIEAFGYA